MKARNKVQSLDHLGSKRTKNLVTRPDGKPFEEVPEEAFQVKDGTGRAILSPQSGEKSRKLYASENQKQSYDSY